MNRRPAVGPLLVISVSIAALVPTLGVWAHPSPDTISRGHRFDRVDDYIREKVENRQLAGAVLLIAQHGRILHLRAIGAADQEHRVPMRTDTIFRIYSMTKPIAATALLMLYDEGKFQLDDPISKYLPQFHSLRVLRAPDAKLADTVPLVRGPTIGDVLTLRGGFGGSGDGSTPLQVEYLRQGLYGIDTTLETLTDRLAKLPLASQPGVEWRYGISPDIQARLVEVISGMPFDVFVRRRILAPLGMNDTGYWVPGPKAKRLATVYWLRNGALAPINANNGGPLGAGFIFDPALVSGYLAPHGRRGGGYGLVSTATDYWRFAQMLLNKGEFAGTRLLKPETVALMTTNHLTGEQTKSFPFGWGFGLAVDADPKRAAPASAGTFYWGGAASTHFWVDPKADLVAIVMTQQVPTAGDDIGTLPTKFRELVYGSLP